MLLFPVEIMRRGNFDLCALHIEEFAQLGTRAGRDFNRLPETPW
jgi:hypothetical protein